MHQWMQRIAKLMAILGGLVLLSLVAITCLSVLGRAANTLGHGEFFQTYLGFLSSTLKSLGPINGDYEMVEIGVAFSIFAFLPWCQLNRSHATVELFTSMFPDRLNRFLMFFWELVFAAILVLIAWRIYVGMTDKLRYGETTFLLQIPVWWGYAICTFAAVIAAVIGIYSAWLHFRELGSGDLPPATERSPGH